MKVPAARLFTVEVVARHASHVGRGFTGMTFYEATFAGLRFSREHEADLQHWVRVAARNRYGKNTLVIFVHKHEGEEQ